MDTKADYLGEENKCCGTAMKVWLIICNVILLILGVAALGVGIWVQGQPGFAWTAGSVGVGLIVLGVFLMLIAVMGMIAAWKELRCLMAFYALLLFIFFIAELAALVVSAAATDVAVNLVNEGWIAMSEDQKDGVGIYFGCCGVEAARASKYNADGASTCNAGESDPEDEKTHTMGTGICTVFGMDYAVDGKVSQVSFPQYKKSFVEDTKCEAKNKATAIEVDKLACALLNKNKTECEKACTWVPAPGAVCMKSKADIEGNACVASSDTCAKIPEICLCEGYDDKGVAVDNKVCRNLKAEIPLCSSVEPAVFPFVAGTENKLVNVKDLTVSAPMAACYSKFETWLAENMMTCIIITAFVFVYQLIQLIFSFMLCCGFCSNKKKSDDEADLGPSGI